MKDDLNSGFNNLTIFAHMRHHQQLFPSLWTLLLSNPLHCICTGTDTYCRLCCSKASLLSVSHLSA